MNLAGRVLYAGFWFGLAFVLVRLCGLLRLSILTHLLVPQDFGLMALITLVVGSLSALSDVGIAAAIMQRSRLDTSFLHTAWHMNWMRGLGLTTVCWLCAPLAAVFFDRPDLASLLRWAALIPLIQGLESLGIVLLQRELDFQCRTLLDLVRETVHMLVAVLLALYWQASAEALVGGLIAGISASAIFSYFVHGYRPGAVFSRTAAWEIWQFGGHLLGAGMLIFAMTNLDNLVVGKLLGTEPLGYYGLAFTLTGILTNQLVHVFNTVMFPALSQIHHDQTRMRRVIGISARLIVGVLTPIVCVVGLVPQQLIRLALGEHWLPAVPVLRVLLAMGWVRGLGTVFGPVLLAGGRTVVIHRMKWIEFTVFACTIVPAVHVGGISGAAWVLLLVYLISLLLHMRAVERDFPGTIRHALAQIMHGVIPGAVALGCAWLLKRGVVDDVISGPLWSALAFMAVWATIFWGRELGFVKEIRRMTAG